MKVWSLLFAGVAAIGCSDVTSPASLAPTGLSKGSSEVQINDKLPTSITIGACNGEIVSLDGDQHVVIKANEGKDGSLKLSISSDLHFSGNGSATGAKYVGDQKYTETDAIGIDTYSYRSIQSMTLNGQGKVPDTVMDIMMKVTVHSDGSASFRQDFSTRCK
jgi:diaminopimelate epimerase